MTINQQLQGLYSLDHNIKLYIPSTKNANESTDNTAYINEALELFGACFGGATAYDALGSWVSNDKGLIVEPVKIIESYASKEALTNGGLAKVLQYAKKIKTELKQEAVSLEYDNKLYFI